MLSDIIICQSVARRELVKKKTEGLHSAAEFWRLEVVLSDRMNETHETTKSRHFAARTIQTAYGKYTRSNNEAFDNIVPGVNEETSDENNSCDSLMVDTDVKNKPNHLEDKFATPCEVAMPSQFSPSSYMSEMAKSIQSVISDCVEEAKDFLEARLEDSTKDKPQLCIVNADTDAPIEVAILEQFSPSSIMSVMDDKDLAQFVSAVVVIQSYLHETSEKKNVNATLTQMDSFEFENFYRGMLYGVDGPETAVRHIVICQSAVRRMIARRKIQQVRTFFF